MNKAKRKAVIAGNWKMNKTATEAASLIDALVPAVQGAGCDVVICTPFTSLCTAVEKCAGTNIGVGAENVHFEKSGAFTGEISADMLMDLGVKYVITGHSERRQYFAETDETVNKRTKAALAAGLTVIVCVGESLAQREQGVTEELVRMQTKIALGGVSSSLPSRWGPSARGAPPRRTRRRKSARPSARWWVSCTARQWPRPRPSSTAAA